MKNYIKKVSLLGNGVKGLKATIVEYRTSKDGLYIPSENNKKQNIAVTAAIGTSFRKLRYYLLETTERIPSEWKELGFFKNGEFQQNVSLKGDAQKRAWAECQDLVDRTFVTEVTYDANDNGGYRLSGTITSPNGYVAKTESPLITDEDSTIFYREVVDIVGALFEQTITFLYGEGLSVKEATIRQLIEEDATVADLTEEEQLARAAKILEKRGCIIIPSDEDTAMALSQGNAVTDLEDEVLGQVEEVESEEVEVKETIFDHTAGEDTFTEVEDVTDMEDNPADTGQTESFDE